MPCKVTNVLFSDRPSNHLVVSAFDFQLPVPDFLSEGQQSRDVSNDSTLVEEDDSLPDCIHTAEGPHLTARGRYQVSHAV